MIDKNNPIPLYLQVKASLERDINTGLYPPNSQLPTEQQLIKTFQVGRATIRMAISELSHEGKVIKKHGIGTFVSDAPSPLAFEPLISLSYSLKSMGITNKNTLLKNECIVPTPTLMTDAHLKSSAPLQHLLRIRYADTLPLVMEHSYLSASLYEAIKDYDLSDSLADLILHKAGITLSKIDQSIQFRIPTEEEQDYLGITSTDSVIELTRWLYTHTEAEPIYYLHFTMLSSVLSYPFHQLHNQKTEGY